MKWSQIIDDYLVFSKKERLGMYVLAIITLLVWLVPYFFSKNERIENIFEVTYLQLDSAKQVLLSRQSNANKKTNREFTHKRSMGADTDWHEENRQAQNASSYVYFKKKIPTIDINKADSSQLEQLPGIGEKLSSRIVRFRDRLGGFLEISQLREVYGISDSMYAIIIPYLKVEAGFSPQKIAINKADYATLRKHPYMDHEFIKMVLAYRKSHGNYQGKGDLEKIIQLDLTKLEKVMPYLSFED